MARVLFSLMARVTGGPTRGGLGNKVTFYDDEACTVPSTVYRRSTGVGAQPNPIIPNAGVQRPLLADRLAADAFVTVTDVGDFNVGDIVPIFDGVNEVEKVITVITPLTKRLDLDSALGFNFAASNTKVNRTSRRGHVHAWLDNAADKYFVAQTLAGERMPVQHLPIAAPVASIAVREEGTLVNNRPAINFIGGVVTAVDDAGNNRINVTILAGPDNASYVTTATEAGLSNESVLGTAVIMAGTNAGRPAASLSGRIYVTTDAPITIQRDNGATWLAAGFQNPMTATWDLILGTTSGGQSRLAVGVTNDVLSVIAGAIGWRYPGLTTAEADLGGDVTMTNANQFYDGPSVSIGVAAITTTWLIVATATVRNPASTANHITAKLWNGAAVEQSGSMSEPSSSVLERTVTLIGLVTLTGTATWKISVANTNAASTLQAAATNNGAGNNASSIRALRVA